MALAMLAEIPDLTREEYELVVRKVNESGSPAGALFHAGGPIEGGYRVVEVWESREAANTFYGSELYKEATASSPTQPKILMTWAVSGVDRGSGWQPAD
ncbi:MAG TPA: hypothetical protein VHN80_08500 [Kineosporiaceae bacterium]|jgi:hypothetical protein|nr:hypothetical protein [Kineosporiaceae bacterium]